MQIIKRYQDFRDSNVLYQEYSSSHEHMHLNATRWSTLTDYISYLGKEGICKVEERPNGLYIKYIRTETDDAILKPKKRIYFNEKSEEERERAILTGKIERAYADKSVKPIEFTELKRAEGVQIKLALKPLAKPTGPKLIKKNKILK